MPTTPGGRFSPGDSDDWDLTTDLAAMQVSNEAATASEITAAVGAVRQNYRIGTRNQRTALSGADLYVGLRFYETDTTLTWGYSALGWRPVTGSVLLEMTIGGVNIGNATEAELGSGTPWVEVTDPLAFHNPTVNPQRITPSIPGRYRVSFSSLWAVNGAGVRYNNLRRNGANSELGVLVPNPGSVGSAAVSGIMEFNGTTDYLIITGYQTSGGSLALASARATFELIKAT